MTNQIIPLNGHVRIRCWEKQLDGAEKLVKDDTIKNLIVNVGKDSLLKHLGNIGGNFLSKIGVGDSTIAVGDSQTNLQAATNYLWKQIEVANKVYVRPTIYVSCDFGYSDANFTWNELGLRDNTDVLIARQVDPSPLVKTSSKRAIVEWQLSL